MGVSSLRYVTTLIGLVTINIVIVEMFLICHVTSREHMSKGLCEVMGGSPPVSHYLGLFGGHWSSASGD